MKLIQTISDGIGAVSEWTGRTARWLILVLIAAMFYEVLMRYAFNRPTQWVFCVSFMIGACLYALSFCYTYYHRGNVRVDVLYNRFPPKMKLVIDIVFTFLMFFPLYFVLAKIFIQDFQYAYSIQQVYSESAWMPITWPYKLGLAVGFCLLFLQGIGTFLKDVMTLVKDGKEPW